MCIDSCVDSCVESLIDSDDDVIKIGAFSEVFTIDAGISASNFGDLVSVQSFSEALYFK